VNKNYSTLNVRSQSQSDYREDATVSNYVGNCWELHTIHLKAVFSETATENHDSYIKKLIKLVDMCQSYTKPKIVSARNTVRTHFPALLSLLFLSASCDRARKPQ